MGDGFGHSLFFFWKVARFVAIFLFFSATGEKEVAMERKSGEKPLKQRIRSGEIRRQDVTRRLAELAFGKANDCVKLALEENLCLDELDLSLLSEVKRNDKGTVEIRLIDRLRALEQLAQTVGAEASDVDAFLQALQGGGSE